MHMELMMSWKYIKGSVALLAALVLVGCGAGGGGSTADPGGGVPLQPTVTITLVDRVSGAPITTLSAAVAGRLTATVKDASGVAVEGALVTFTTDGNYGVFSPASGTTLTDASGNATMLIDAGASAGASTVSVTAVWKENNVDVTVTGALNYLVSTAGPVGISISNPVFGTSPLSAYGTTSVSVTVTGTTNPMTVNFTSTCAAAGKAVLTPSVTTIGGVATASYRDDGCANTDTITATLTSGVASSGQLVVTAPSAGSIQFVSATPNQISLKGTGGAGRQEFSTVVFKVLDTAGKPIARQVDFTLSTTAGGIVFSGGATSATANSDGATGLVQAIVNSGTVATPLRVNAQIDATTIKTQSDQLFISTGIPDQVHTSLSATTLNIEGWQYDGVTTQLTMRLADHFSNSVPDGTAVSFIAEGGKVEAGCLTDGFPAESACSVTFTSQALRPVDGRVTILGYAVGEESFIDTNGNGTVDAASEMKDANGGSTALGEAYLDMNEDGVRGAGETYIDYNVNAAYDDPVDGGNYVGILCTPGAAICSSQDTLHVFRNIVVTLSGSSAQNGLVFSNAAPLLAGNLDLGATTCQNTISFNLVMVDVNDNPLPAGTRITVETTDGTIVQGASHVVPNSNASHLLAPLSSAFNFPVTIKNDTPLDSLGACPGTGANDQTPSGILTVTSTTPKGVVTTHTLGVVN